MRTLGTKILSSGKKSYKYRIKVKSNLVVLSLNLEITMNLRCVFFKQNFLALYAKKTKAAISLGMSTASIWIVIYKYCFSLK